MKKTCHFCTDQYFVSTDSLFDGYHYLQHNKICRAIAIAREHPDWTDERIKAAAKPDVLPSLQRKME